MQSWLMLADGEGVVILFMLFAFALSIGSLILWIWALLDAIKNPMLSDNDRIIWVVVIAVLQVLGAIIYLAIGRNGSGRSGRF